MQSYNIFLNCTNFKIKTFVLYCVFFDVYQAINHKFSSFNTYYLMMSNTSFFEINSASLPLE